MLDGRLIKRSLANVYSGYVIHVESFILPDISLEDSGNYTCEVRGPQSTILGQVTHQLFVRGK